MLRDLSQLTREDWDRLAEDPEALDALEQKILKERKEAARFEKLADYYPYGHPATLCPDGWLYREKRASGEWEAPWSNKPWQLEFHNAGKFYIERMSMSANRVGKCITFNTLVQTAHGPVRVGDLFRIGKSFGVLAWDGQSVRAVRALAPFKKPGLHDCYLLITSSGEWVEAADHHRILLDGSWRYVQHLQQSAVSRLLSTLGLGRAVHALGVQHSFGRLLGFLARCSLDRHPGGAQPHPAQDTVPARVPLLADVPQHSVASWFAGAVARIHTNIVRLFYGLRSNWDVTARDVDQLAGFSSRDAYRYCPPYHEIHQGFLQRATAAASFPRSVAGLFFQEPQDEPSKILASKSPLLSTNDIIACISIGRQEVYDFTVPGLHNYIAGGLIHHNTQEGSAETAIHLTGDYPEWWDGIRFEEPILAWTGSPTNETSKDIIQDALLGSDLAENLGTGFIPKDRLVGKPNTRQAGVKDVVDTFRVRHSSGGVSKCICKTYEQGWKKWQGTAPHVVWLDEEPDDYKIFSEAQTRVMTSKGTVMVTFTPLQGTTEIVEHFEEHAGRHAFINNATWDDAPHLGEQEKAKLRALYRAHEVDARTKGIPMMGAGAIFPFPEDMIKCPVIPIPNHWARIKGIDFGIYHHQATADCAWDRDADVFYVMQTYRKKGNTAGPHAMQINATNDWVPVAWPHDGENKDKGTGIRLVRYYLDHGCAMLPTSACYPKAPREKREKLGSQPVQPIIDEIIERMMTGRFKVFETCPEFFDEYRSYHRDEKGQIVHRRDDILKAVFMALMMKRKAVSRTEFFRTRTTLDIPAGLSTAV